MEAELGGDGDVGGAGVEDGETPLDDNELCDDSEEEEVLGSVWSDGDSAFQEPVDSSACVGMTEAEVQAWWVVLQCEMGLLGDKIVVGIGMLIDNCCRAVR